MMPVARRRWIIFEDRARVPRQEELAPLEVHIGAKKVKGENPLLAAFWEGFNSVKKSI